MNNKIYYNFDKLFSYNFLLAFVIGERGVGKSFNAKVAMLRKYLKNGEQFIYVRRYKTELESALNNFWTDLQEHGYFEDLNLKVKKSKMVTEFLCEGEVCGYAIPLSTSNILKSTAFPNVKTIIFDEYMLDNAGTYHYLKSEVTMMLDMIETVGRLRDIQVIFLGNNTAFYGCPYTAYFDLELPYNSEFKTFKDGTIVVNYIKNEAYRAAKKDSKFGRLVSGTPYGDYAIDNKSLRENTDFIMKKSKKSKFLVLLIINGERLGVWWDADFFYVEESYDPNSTHKFVFDYNYHTEDTELTTARENYYLKMIIKYYKYGFLRFSNLKVKSTMVSLLNRCICL